MLNIALFEPKIPQNTGNIIRLTANNGYHLHLIEPLGFDFEEKNLRRSGLDYFDMAKISRYPDYQAFLLAMQGNRILAINQVMFYCLAQKQRVYLVISINHYLQSIS